MDNNDRATSTAAANGSILLGGKVYLVGQPTEQDAMTVAVFLRKRAKSKAMRLQDDPEFQLLPEDERRRLVLAAATEKFKDDIPFDAYAVMDLLASAEGTRFLAFVLLRKNHPEITYESLATLITEENAFGVYLELNAASGMEALGNLVGRAGSVRTPEQTAVNSTSS